MAKRLRLCVLAIFFLASLIASAQARSAADSRWTVHVQEDGPHPTNKRINCHALKYFQDTKNLKAFDYGGLLADPPAENPDKVQSERVGEIEGFVVYDVIHTIGCHENCGPEEQFFRLLKMILVERKPGEFCEIYHEQGESEMLTIEAAYIGRADTEQILVTNDRISGTGNDYNEAYWTFDKEGPILLDMNLVDETVGSLLPDGMDVQKGGAFEIGTLTYDSAVWKEGDGGCCPSGGEVHIKFALENHKLVVVEKKFEPAKHGLDKPDAGGIFACSLI